MKKKNKNHKSMKVLIKKRKHGEDISTGKLHGAEHILYAPTLERVPRLTHKPVGRPEREMTEEQLIKKISRLDSWRDKLELRLREIQDNHRLH